MPKRPADKQHAITKVCDYASAGDAVTEETKPFSVFFQVKACTVQISSHSISVANSFPADYIISKKEFDQMTRFRPSTALLYSGFGAFGICFLASLAFGLLDWAGLHPIAALPRMFLYHVDYFVLYFGIIALFYGVFLFLWLRYHPKTWWGYWLGLILGGFLIVCVSSYPCALLYILHDMLAGFYPDNFWRTLLCCGYDILLVGWRVVVFSFPLNFFALLLFLGITWASTHFFDAGYEPKWFVRLKAWGKKHPDRLFCATGMVLFSIAFSCCLIFVEYDSETLFSGIRITLFGLMGGVSAALISTLLCWCVSRVSRKLAWGILLASSLALAWTGIWRAIPQNKFIDAMGPAYNRQMRLLKLKGIAIKGEGFRSVGEISCPDSHMHQLRETGVMDVDGKVRFSPYVTEFSRIAPDRYSFVKRLTGSAAL